MAGDEVTVEDPCAEGERRGESPDELVVCIDPGHQKRSNMSAEPIGPGSDEGKPKVTGGTTGVKTRLPEHEVDAADLHEPQGAAREGRRQGGHDSHDQRRRHQQLRASRDRQQGQG